MNGPAHSRREALHQIATGLGSLESRAEAGLAGFDTALRRALSEAAAELADRLRTLAAAQAALHAADDENRQACEEAVRRAEAEVAAAQRAVRTIEGERDRFLAVRRRYEQQMREAVSRGRAELRRLGLDLERYTANSGGAGQTDGNGSGGEGGAVGVASRLTAEMGSRGLELVDVATVDLTGESMATDHERPQGDYRWLLEKWDTVVGPGVEAGLSREDLAARDSAAAAPEGRRLAEVYDVMLGSKPVGVSIDGDGRVTASSGRHRVFHAQQLGITRIPARVHRVSP